MITDGICNQCEKKTTNHLWCHSCNSFRFKKDFDKWTSGNKDADDFIQKAQLEATSRYKVLEWIPYEKFDNIKEIGKGGFSKVFSAEWKEGNILFWNKYGQWKRSGEKIVTLKRLNNSQNISKEYLEEVKSLLKLSDNRSQITQCYGITKDKESNFMIVMKFVDRTTTIYEKSWKKKFRRLHYIALGLHKIHVSGVVHRDIHPGNILFSKDNDEVYIADLGLCKPVNSKDRDDKLYGVLPYVAPEVLHKKIHTKAADIFSFGMVMYEVISGISPFRDGFYNNKEGNNILAIRICEGDRPETKVLPPLIIELVGKCWDADPEKRLAAEDLGKILNAWTYFSTNSELAKQINASDMNKTLQPLSRTSEQIYISQKRTSKLLDFKNLPQPQNSKS